MRGYRDHIAKCREIAHEVKNLAYEIIEKKQATYYGIAMSVRRICEVIIRDEKSILPVSHVMHGEYGVDHVALSIPAIVGKDGVESHVPLTLDAGELKALSHSARTLRGILDECGLE
jgi:L-lactate dehydrogenase